MSSEPSEQAEQIPSRQHVRPSWWRRFAHRPAPSWFTGGELDVLEPLERDALYRKASNGHRTHWFVLVIVIVMNLPNLIRGVSTPTHRMLWIGATIVTAGVWIFAFRSRRKSLVLMARRLLRESPEWPELARRRRA